jgi:hypothetical protein
MFEGFLRLERATDERILEFAQRWGPLGICEHGLPHTHWPLNTWDGHAASLVRASPPGQNLSQCERDPARSLPCFIQVPIRVAVRIAAGKGIQPERDGGERELVFTRPFCEPSGCSEQDGRGGHEPLAAWRRFSEEANAILKLAALLHANDGKVQVPSRLADLVHYGSYDANEDPGSTEWVDWRWLQPGLDRWIGYGNVRPSLIIHRSGPTICLGSASSLTEGDLYINAARTGFFFGSSCGLFGALAAQLLLTCQNRGGFDYCTECGSFYEPERKPRAGERKFCSEECRSKRSKFAARDLRERKRAAGRTATNRRRGSGRRSQTRPQSGS